MGTMAQFPNHPMFHGFHRPLRTECEVFELGYEGRIPEAANGAFYRCGPDDEDAVVQEPAFVPAGGKSVEGVGYLPAVVNRPLENRGDLIILDAMKLATGPVAMVRLPLLMRMAFHGNWGPKTALKRARVRQAPELQ